MIKWGNTIPWIQYINELQKICSLLSEIRNMYHFLIGGRIRIAQVLYLTIFKSEEFKDTMYDRDNDGEAQKVGVRLQEGLLKQKTT